MSIIAGYAVRSDGLALSEAVSRADIRLDIERTVATDPERPSLFLWAEGDDIEAFDAAIHEDPTVTDIRVLSDLENKRLYSVRLTDETQVVLYPKWVKLGAEQLEAYYNDGWWHARARFPDRQSFATYREFLQENDVEFRLKHLYSGAKAASDTTTLTPEQEETLQLAYKRGYFDVPRGVTTTELAAELGVSDQAVSERLRRGYARLIESSVQLD